MIESKNPAPQLSGNRGFENNSFRGEFSNTLNQNSNYVNNTDLLDVGGFAQIFDRANALANHPDATEAINGLARITIKPVKRIPYDPDASFAAMLFFDRLERLAKGENFKPAIHKGAFSANRGRK